MPDQERAGETIEVATPEQVEVEKKALYYLLNAVVKNQIPQSYVGPGRVMILKELFGLSTFEQCQEKWNEVLAFCEANVH
jgi:hypothetical protein